MARALALLCVLAIARPVVADSRPPTQTEQAVAHYQRGQAAYAEGRWEDALHEFELGYALAPRPEFLVNFAQVHRRLGRYGDAVIDCERYLATRPGQRMTEEVGRLLVAIREEAARAQMAGGRPAPAPTLGPSPTPPPTLSPLPSTSTSPSPSRPTSTSTSPSTSKSTSTSTSTFAMSSPSSLGSERRKRVGLIVGLSIGGVVLVGGAVALGVLLTRAPGYPASDLRGDFR